VNAVRLISPELTTAILTAFTVAGAWFATWLGRRGKKEDTRISERGQAFDQLVKLAENRLVEINRLSTERDAAVVEREKVRVSWEERWDRQMVRCREITEDLVATIGQLRILSGPAGRQAADDTLRALDEHNERDHTSED
jgi:hypothetical protein